MSLYAVVLTTVKEHTGKTAAQLATLLGMEEPAVDNMLADLTRNGRITKSGSGSGATYASTSEQ
jgi:DNA-binding IclR family transcriptional regulator